MPINGNFVKIGDIELSSLDSLDTLIAKAKELYLWKIEARPIVKSENDIELEKIFEERTKPDEDTKQSEFFNV